MDFIMTIVEQGLIYGILTLGIYITYKILDFPDLTVDGSFPLGAAVISSTDHSWDQSLPDHPDCISGRRSGRYLYRSDHVKCKVRDLLSGIIMMTALYTVNLENSGNQ